MGLDVDLPVFPPTSPDSRYSMVFSAMVTILSMIYEYIMVMDLRWGSPARREMHLTDPRMVTLQLRETWEFVAVAVFLSRGELPADHPYRDVACGVAAAYIAGKFAFNLYHIVGTALACLAFGVKHSTIAVATLIQLFEPLVCVASLISLASITASLTPGMTPGGTVTLVRETLRWALTGIDCPIAIGGAMATALLLWRTQIQVGKTQPH
jgi:hypothetical protein